MLTKRNIEDALFICRQYKNMVLAKHQLQQKTKTPNLHGEELDEYNQINKTLYALERSLEASFD